MTWYAGEEGGNTIRAVCTSTKSGDVKKVYVLAAGVVGVLIIKEKLWLLHYH